MAFQKIHPVPIENASNAVIYARYSPGHDQSENSIDFQLRAGREYCERCGYTIVGEYIDRSKSGTTDDRENFQRMILDSHSQQFAFVVVYRFDRFARNRYDASIYKKQLESRGVRVLSTEEYTGMGDEAVILESIYDAMAESYSRRLSKITRLGMRETAAKGLWTGGNVPLGYRVEDQRLFIDDRTAPAVRLMFEQYASGKTKTQIANELNAAGYKTKKGNPFTCANFTTILTNKMYYGDYSMGDIERSCPAIISKELFDRVQSLLESNKRCFGRKVSETFFALGGKAFCGYCGSALIGDCGTSRTGERHHYYSCGKRKRSHTCKKRSEAKGNLEFLVCQATVGYVLSPGRIEEIARRVVAKDQAERASGELDALEKRVKTLNQEIDVIVEALIKTDSAAAIKRINEKLETLEKQLAAAQAELTHLRVLRDAPLKEEGICQYLASFCNGNLEDEDYRRRLINMLVNCVYVFDDKLVIYFNLGSNIASPTHAELLRDLEEECSGSDRLGGGEPYTNQSERQAVCYFFHRGLFGVKISRN